MRLSLALHPPAEPTRFWSTVPSFSVHPDELAESTKKTLNNRAYFYANSNAGLGWTDRANRFEYIALLLAPPSLTFFMHCREAFYRWRIVPRMLVDTNTRDLTSESLVAKISLSSSGGL